ncbi:facilitated trehalose transporter Tret1-like [Hyposmocoma kahamanoa]|uniref:facilitated trehalose transporter Tret1-like n=1 Tax=Hyposmocoma kahamanoa TaxID=1477025 RepID=UPI000E6D88B8|nr:facilitated trehalose transporter Tret1-like [Hyposmocoma kahamanoa]
MVELTKQANPGGLGPTRVLLHRPPALTSPFMLPTTGESEQAATGERGRARAALLPQRVFKKPWPCEAAFIVNILVFVYGASIGWMSPMTLLLQSDKSPVGRPLSDAEISWIASIAYLTCVPADFLIAYLSDKIGRKNSLFLLSLTSVCCWAIKLCSYEVWAFVLARALMGIVMGGAYVTCPLYTKDISEDSVRGLLGSLVILFHTTGNLFSYIIGDLLSFRIVLWICLTIAIFHLILCIIIPESPSFLIKQGKEDKAVKILAWLRCRRETDSLVQREIEIIKKEQKTDENSSNFALKAILKDKILFRAFKIAIIVALAREVCGAIPVLNFAGDIFATASKGTNFVLTPNQQAMMLGLIQVTGSMLGSSVVEKAGRKALLAVTALISGISMCALASWFVAKSYGVDAASWLPLATLCICIFCDSSGLQPVSVIITSEIFSYKYRGTVMGTAMAAAAVCAFIQMFFFKNLATSIGLHVSFYFFGAVCMFAALYTILVIPETKLRSLEEVHQDLRTKKEKREEKALKEVSV